MICVCMLSERPDSFGYVYAVLGQACGPQSPFNSERGIFQDNIITKPDGNSPAIIWQSSPAVGTVAIWRGETKIQGFPELLGEPESRKSAAHRNPRSQKLLFEETSAGRCQNWPIG